MSDTGDPRPKTAALPASRRALWLRPALFALFALSLPFTWTEETPRGCDGRITGAAELESGYQVLFEEPKTVGLFVALAAVCVVLGLLTPRVRAWLRVVAHAVAALAAWTLFAAAHFAATFTLVSEIRLRLAGLLGLGALAAVCLDALARALCELVHLLRTWLAQRRRSTASDE